MNRAHFHVSLKARSGPFPRGEWNSRQASESLEPSRDRAIRKSSLPNSLPAGSLASKRRLEEMTDRPPGFFEGTEMPTAGCGRHCGPIRWRAG